jgi:hypothetical protein
MDEEDEDVRALLDEYARMPIPTGPVESSDGFLRAVERVESPRRRPVRRGQELGVGAAAHGPGPACARRSPRMTAAAGRPKDRLFLATHAEALEQLLGADPH